MALVATLLPATATVGADVDLPALPGSPVADPRPNIVLITTDDMRLDDLRVMPRTRHLLGDAGVSVGTALSPHPLCCPARAQVLTGQYAHHHGVRANNGAHGGYPSLQQPDRTVARWLQDAGYRTGFVGKFLNGYEPATPRPAGWTTWNPFVTDVYEAYGVGILDQGQVVEQRETHSNDVVRDYSIDALADLSASEAPFFLWSSYVAPHGTCAETSACSDAPQPAARHQSLFPGIANVAERKASYDDARGNRFGFGPTGRRSSPATLRHTNRKRLQSLVSVDEGIAATLDELERLGELDDTLVVFTSDNGYLLGEHGFQGKNVPYEEALRVPFLVRGPSLPRGVVRRAMTASLVDVAPTLAAVARARPSRSGPVDGVDLMPYLRGDRAAPSYTQLIDIGPSEAYGSQALPWTLRGVRTKRFTLLRWTRSGRIQLFDRSADRSQRHDVAAEPRYRQVRTTLVRRLDALVDCTGAAQCRRTSADLSPSNAGRRSSRG